MFISTIAFSVNEMRIPVQRVIVTYPKLSLREQR